MKIKNITAPSMMEAFAVVKEQLGEDAVIISSENTPDGQVLITAALEEDFEIGFDDCDEVEVFDSKNCFDDNVLRKCLDYHGVVPVILEKIMATARQVSTNEKLFDDQKILEKTFAKIYRYEDILDLRNPVKLFMGTPGSGKSTAIAKTATQAKFNKISTCIISTDNVRAGANKQLEAFAKILELDFYFCKDDRSLYDTVKKAEAMYRLILVDTPGINPFITKEVDRVGRLSEIVKNEGIITFDAGRNPYEAVEIAEIFAGIGAKYLLPTRLDLTRRIGSILSIAGCCNLNFCSASVSASIANGLAEIDYKSLAKLVLTEE